MPGLISPATLEQIRAASDIVDVIGGYVPLKRAGGNFVALCPFHKEKTPSFNVNPQRQIFHCFGCHKGGDVFTFVKEYENIGFMDAVRRLADRANIVLEFEKTDAGQQSRHLKDRLLEIHEQIICQRWQNALANEASGQAARDYLAKRGVGAEAMKLFRLGAAPEAWDDTVNWAKSKGHELALVEKAGLIIRKEETGNYYDRFRGRLMFPICDEQGRVIGFSGRVLSGDERTAKYVNSPETPIFTKGKVLFALDRAKRSILDLGFAVVCEGQLDTIACHAGGVSNAIAPQGTALTAAHARILRRYTDDIILCFDGDAAGQRASARAFDDLLAAGIPFRVVSIPPPDDPDSFIKRFGKDAFIRLLIAANDFHEFYLNYLCSQHDVRTASGRQKIVALVCESVQKTGSPTLIDTYAQRTAQRLGVLPDAVRTEFKKILTNARTGPAPAQDREIPAPSLPAPSTQEFWLLKLLLLNEDVAALVAAGFDPGWVEHPTVRCIVSRRLAAQSSDEWHGVAALLADCEDDAMRGLVTETTADDRPVPNAPEQLQALAIRLRNQFLDRQLAAVTLRASQPETPETERLELLRHQRELWRLKQAPLTPILAKVDQSAPPQER